MKVLQIALGVSYTNIYKNFFLELKNKEVEFEVYIPQHTDKSVPVITSDDFPFSFYTNKIIKPYDKYLYFSKVRRMTKDVIQNFTLSKFTLIHSHSLFSDGAVAYQLNKKYKIPYIVAVRDTDVNQYFKKAIHLRKYALKILMNARNIIFISKSYRDNVLNNYVPNKLKKQILAKTRVIPNGIDNFWLDNKYRSDDFEESEELKLLFVGQIIKRKNILKIVETAKKIREKHRKKVRLILIGAKKDEDYFDQIINSGEDLVEYIPYISKEKLITYYRKSSIFIMPSLTETFGLVYAEAMSQGLPIIYTKGEGFDKQFDEGEVGYSVNPMDVDDIADKVKLIMNNRQKISQNCIDKVDKFDWKKIVKEYVRLYSN